MKILILVLFLIFSFQPFSNAEKIGEFEIEGIVLKESLLKYFDKGEIDQKKKNGFVYPNKSFYSATFISSKFNNFKSIQFHLKSNDNKYIIYSISGNIFNESYSKNIVNCHEDMNGVISDIKIMFENPKVVDVGIRNHEIDQYTKVKTIFIDLYEKETVESAIVVQCYDWSKEYEEQGKIDKMSISIDSREFDDWLNNEAFKPQ